MAQAQERRGRAIERSPNGSAVKLPSGSNVVLGIWLIIAPFILGYTIITAAMWNDILVGLAVVILAGIRVSRPTANSWLSWANVVLGVWLIIAPFALGYTGTIALWNDMVVGLVVAAFGVWSALVTPDTTPDTTATPRTTATNT